MCLGLQTLDLDLHGSIEVNLENLTMLASTLSQMLQSVYIMLSMAIHSLVKTRVWMWSM